MNRAALRMIASIVTAVFSLLVGLDLIIRVNDATNGTVFVCISIIMIFVAIVTSRSRNRAAPALDEVSVTRPSGSLLRSIGLLGCGSIAIALYLVATGLSRGGPHLYLDVPLALGFLLFGLVMLLGLFRGLRVGR